MTLYRHTQIGWVYLAALFVGGAILVPMLVRADALGWALLAAVLLLAAMALFGTLTVEVTDQDLRVRFGIGLIRLRIPLARIRAYRACRDPWYYGWGLRIIPGGVLYRISGLDAVEVVLDNGKMYHIGTDEPEALLAVLQAKVGRPAPLSEHVVPAGSPWTYRVGVAIAGAILLTVATLLFLESRPPTVQVVEGTVQARSTIYRATVPCETIQEVRLLPELPPIRRRTNGSAIGDALRGHFELADGTRVVDRGQPPFVWIRGEGPPLVVNLPDPQATRDLYQAVIRCWEEHRG